MWLIGKAIVTVAGLLLGITAVTTAGMILGITTPGTMTPIGDGVHLITIPHGILPGVIIMVGMVRVITAGMVLVTTVTEAAVVPVGAVQVTLITVILVLIIVILTVPVAIPALIPTTTMVRTVLSVALAAVVLPLEAAAVEVPSVEDVLVVEDTLMEEGDSWLV